MFLSPINVVVLNWWNLTCLYAYSYINTDVFLLGYFYYKLYVIFNTYYIATGDAHDRLDLYFEN